MKMFFKILYYILLVAILLFLYYWDFGLAFILSLTIIIGMLFPNSSSDYISGGIIEDEDDCLGFGSCSSSCSSSSSSSCSSGGGDGGGGDGGEG